MIFGGTGSIGTALVEHLIENTNDYIRVFSNSENELWEAKQRFGSEVEYILGDIRNYHAVSSACQDVKSVINCAAIKHISFCDENPMEAINVNILGLYNIINACIRARVSKLLQISTDKAVEPVCVMGYCKALGEKLCSYYDKISPCKIACVRLGNVYGSRGSLVPIVRNALENGMEINLTHPLMRRYFIKMEEVVFWVLDCLKIMEGGEIYIPKLKEFKIVDVINDLIIINGKNPNEVKINIVGIKPREKMFEKLITESELNNCIEYENMWVIK